MTIYTHNLISRFTAGIVTLVLAGICLGSAMGPAIATGIA
jgi:hypothetical protein